MSVKIAPSLLSADFSCLADEVKSLEEARADWLHLDVMDGHFVPNLTFGPCVVRSLRQCTAMPFDAHLMVSYPSEYIAPFVDAGVDHITVHVEVEEDLLVVLEKIKSFGLKAGLSLNPETPVESLFPYLEIIDLVLVMTVQPGFGGQSFISAPLDKIKVLKNKKPSLTVVVDGGVNAETASICREAGADVLVSGSAIFSANDYQKIITKLRQ